MAKKKSRHSSLWIVLILVVVVLFGIATCPDKQDHKEAVTELLHDYLNEQTGINTENDVLTALCNTLSTKLVDLTVEGNLKVKDYLVCSIGIVEWEGESHKVSVGAFGHVFTASEEDLAGFLEGEKQAL